jgi:hypothetical protein
MRFLPNGVIAAAVIVTGSLILGAPVSAASPAPGWAMSVAAQPSNFQPSDTSDEYLVTVVNVGGVSASEETVTLHDPLPAGVTTSGTPEAGGWTCSEGAGQTSVTCSHAAEVQPLEATRVLTIPVTVSPNIMGQTPRNEVTVEGGTTANLPVASAAIENKVTSAPPAFGVETFSFGAWETDGDTDTQAGDHPNAVTASFHVNSVAFQTPEHGPDSPVNNVKNIVVDLPVGLIGNPLATTRCPESLLINHETENESNCPASSQIGTILVNIEGRPFKKAVAVYNLLPEQGYPAEIGFNFDDQPIVMLASLLSGPTPQIQVTIPGVPTVAVFLGATLTLFGNPAEHDGAGDTTAAFFTNPTQCSSEPLEAKIAVDSWEDPNEWVSKESTVYPKIDGCGLLPFGPTLTAQPEIPQAGAPSGYGVDLKVPQGDDRYPDLATSAIRDVTVNFPEGVSISPSAANGLAGCQAQGPEGINIGSGVLNDEGQDTQDPEATELGAGHPGGNTSPYDDALYHTAPGHCPTASTIGTVEITTPLLSTPLLGHMYLAQPTCGGAAQPPCTLASATDGELYGVYLEAAGSGAIIKLKGTIAANSSSGSLTATFDENPQLPFSELKVGVDGGPRAPLANPQGCATYTTSTDLIPWGAPETSELISPSGFAIDQGCAAHGFTPSFTAGTTSSQAGAYSPFTLTFARQDGEQDLHSIEQTLPPGLLAKLAGVPQCGNTEASAGTCPQSSEIGTVTVGAGPGSDPYYVQGHIYLTGPYNNGPFGEVVEIPAVAGPFNLGTVVVRGSIRINPTTAQATIVSDPFPSILDGIPLQVKTVNVMLNRAGFTFNPTSCTSQKVTGAISSTEGATAGVSSPFTAVNCATLPFKPSFTASTAGQASKAGGASLTVKIASKGGPGTSGEEANIRSVKVDLPKQLPSRLTTLQKACTEAQFNANPAGCPKESDVGTATAHTPVLANPLIGPAYLVSHGNEAFPDLEIVLQGEGITLVLDGNTLIKKGITSSTFKTVPDAPISSFELKLPTGKYSILGTNLPASAHYNLCGQTLNMPTAITGQNGAEIHDTTKIAVSGCTKKKKASKKKPKKRAKKR